MNRIKKLYQAVAICMVICEQTILHAQKVVVETAGQHQLSAKSEPVNRVATRTAKYSEQPHLFSTPSAQSQAFFHELTQPTQATLNRPSLFEASAKNPITLKNSDHNQLFNRPDTLLTPQIHAKNKSQESIFIAPEPVTIKTTQPATPELSPEQFNDLLKMATDKVENLRNQRLQQQAEKSAAPKKISWRSRIQTALSPRKLPSRAEINSQIPEIIRSANESLHVSLTTEQTTYLTQTLQDHVNATVPERPTLNQIQKLLNRIITMIQDFIAKLRSTSGAIPLSAPVAPAEIRFTAPDTIAQQKSTSIEFAPEPTHVNYDAHNNPFIKINPEAVHAIGDISFEPASQTNKFNTQTQLHSQADVPNLRENAYLNQQAKIYDSLSNVETNNDFISPLNERQQAGKKISDWLLQQRKIKQQNNLRNQVIDTTSSQMNDPIMQHLFTPKYEGSVQNKDVIDLTRPQSRQEIEDLTTTQPKNLSKAPTHENTQQFNVSDQALIDYYSNLYS